MSFAPICVAYGVFVTPSRNLIRNTATQAPFGSVGMTMQLVIRPFVVRVDRDAALQEADEVLAQITEVLAQHEVRNEESTCQRSR